MLSQTAEYALRAMSCLAYHPDVLTPTPTLATMTRVPSNYLAKVLQLLAQANLIQGRRGVGGGYKLAKPASEIALLDVVNAVAEINRISFCPLGLPNHSGSLCKLHSIVDQAAARVIDTFENVTLIDLVGPEQPSLPLCDAKVTDEIRHATDTLTINGRPSTPAAPTPPTTRPSAGSTPAGPGPGAPGHP